MIYEFKVIDSLNLQTIFGLPTTTTDFKFIDGLELYQTINYVDSRNHIYDRLNIVEYIVCDRSKQILKVLDFLPLSEQIAFPLDRVDFFDTLSFTESITIVKNTHFYDTLTFKEHISLAVTRHPIVTISNNLNLTQDIGYTTNKPYEGLCTPTYLVCSFSDTKGTLTLNAPNKGNSDNLDLGRLNRRTRAGELIVFRDKNWPQQNVLNLDIPIYSCTQLLQCRNFFSRSLGKIVQYIDHEEFVYHGIVSNTFETTEERDVAYTLHVELTTFLQGY